MRRFTTPTSGCAPIRWNDGYRALAASHYKALIVRWGFETVMAHIGMVRKAIHARVDKQARFDAMIFAAVSRAAVARERMYGGARE